VTTVRKYFDYPPGRVNYLTHISRRHRSVFIEVPKAGCTVVKRVLQFSEHAGTSHEEPVSVHDRSTSPLGAPVRDGFNADELFGPDASYARFAFVRNPYSRALSCYLEKIAGEQWLREMRLPTLGFVPDAEVSFVSFLERVGQQTHVEMDIHWAPQHHLLSLDRISYDFLGRFETFRTDLCTVMMVLDIDAPARLLDAVTAHTTNARDKIAEYFDDEAVDLVRKIYRDDFAKLGYGLDPRFAGAVG
jgi:hypothetical protein